MLDQRQLSQSHFGRRGASSDRIDRQLFVFLQVVSGGADCG
jgi:hypothetical protein